MQNGWGSGLERTCTDIKNIANYLITYSHRYNKDNIEQAILNEFKEIEELMDSFKKGYVR
jgi:hypothetical protein